jgi:sugar lactone lactonase YvrE
MKKRIETKNYKAFRVEVWPSDIYLLPNGHFCLTNEKNVLIYDQRFNVMKKINKINNMIICPASISFNKKNELYISDYKENCIHKMDFNLNLIKSFGGTKGKGNNQFYFPDGLSCKEDLLYVCDLRNERIQILSLDFEYVDTIKLDYIPRSIKISDSTICIAGEDGALYFYNLKNKELKNKYKDVSGRIHKVDSNFYVSNDNGKIQCFDRDGILITKLSMDNQWIPFFMDDCILYLNKVKEANGYEIFYSKI